MKFEFGKLTEEERKRATEAMKIAGKIISYHAHLSGSRLIWRLK